MRQRIRVAYARTGDLRFLSQLDLVRTWERAVRRSGLPVAFSEGFNPRVRLSFSAARPTGMEVGQATVDFFLASETPLGEVRRRLASVLPPGLSILEVASGEGRAPAEGDLQVEIRLADGSAEPPVERTAVSGLLAAGLRELPGVVRLEWKPDCVQVQLVSGSGGARLRAVLDALGLSAPGAPAVVVRVLAPAGDSQLDPRRDA